jgi:hypothetical protein
MPEPGNAMTRQLAYVRNVKKGASFPSKLERPYGEKPQQQSLRNEMHAMDKQGLIELN